MNTPTAEHYRTPEQRRLESRLYRLSILDHLGSRAGPTATPRYAKRAALVEELLSHGPFPKHQDPSPVHEIDSAADFARFMEASHNYRRPVVIRGFGAQCAAVRSWTVESLSERLPAEPCTVVEMDSEALKAAHASRRLLHSMPFSEFVRRMRDGEPLYLHNSTHFAAQDSGLVDDLGLERIQEAFTDPTSSWDELFSTNLFVGGEQVFSNLHCAPGGNFFLQIGGRKTWTLVDPDLSPYLFPIISRPFNHCLSAFGSYHRYSTAGEECPIAGIPRLQVVLEPGDMLYNPPWWWHEVHNEGITIGCAIRHVPSPLSRSPTWSNHRLFSALSVYPQLWAYSALNYMRYRVTGHRGSMRAKLNPRLAQQLNKARGR